MSKALQEKVNQLFEAVAGLYSLEEIKPHCETFNQFINIRTTYTKESLGTVLSRVGFYKKFRSIPLEQGKNAELVEKFDRAGNPKGHELQHYCLLLCGLNNEDWLKRNTTTRVNDRLTSTGQEVDPETYLDVAKKLLESNDPHELAVGLIASTGRRPHEILARAIFYQMKGEEYHVLFEGQGKKRGEKPVFKIATLFPAKYVIEKLNKLRELSRDFLKQIEIEFKDVATQNRKIEDRRGNSLRRVVREYFGGRES
ncbi:MAG: protelomerase family protein, partial [Sphaerospermopsis kisseleviana]